MSNAAVDGEALPLSSTDKLLLDSRGGGTFAAGSGGDVDPSGSSEWDDAALAADTITAASTRSATSALGSLSIADSSFGALHHNHYIDPDNIAEKLRVEETKAALAAAREGMEREAQKLAQEKEQKRLEAAGQATAGTPGAGMGGKWVPSHMRGSMGGGSLRARMMGGSQKLDVADEELFPDLASADKMLAEKDAAEKKRASMATNKPITALSGATWASKMAAKKSEREAAATTGAAAKKVEAPSTAADPVPPEPVKEAAPVEPEKEAAAPPDLDASKPVVPKKLVKRVKKDLSTFKAGGAS